MKTNTQAIALFSLAAAMVSSPLFGADTPASTADDSRISVQFVDPDNYTDFKTSSFGGPSEQAALIRELTNSLEKDVRRFIPDGYKVSLVVRDIDLAGDIDLYRVSTLDDVRIIRSIFPPRIKLEYTVTNSAGTVVLSGEERLQDLAFDWRIRMSNRDYTFFEQEMLTDFMRDVGKKLALG